MSAPLNTLPAETLLKKRKNADKQRVEKQAAAADRKKPARSALPRATFERAEKFVKAYRDAEREEVRLKNVADTSSSELLEIPAKPKLLFVVRLDPKGTSMSGKVAPKPRKVLQLLGLLQPNSGVFVKLTKSTAELLRIVEPYVAFGYPSLASVRKLVYKRGYGKVDRQRVALTDNAIIETALGKYGIICLEDLIHELYTVGPNFKAASTFLWPFKLSSGTGGFGVRTKMYKAEAAQKEGPVEDDINALIDAQN